MCASTRAAVDASPQQQAAVSANQAVADSYVRNFQADYAKRHAGKPELAKDVPPLDMVAGVRAAQAEKKSLEDCVARRAEFKTEMEMVKCRVEVFRGFSATEKLQDTDLVDSFAAAFFAAAADADAGKITPQQMLMAVTSVANAFDSAVFLQYGNYMFGLTKAPAGDAPPFDYAALPGAVEMAKQAQALCAAGSEADYLGCLEKLDAAFNSAIKMGDLTLANNFRALMDAAATTGGAAGKMSRDELSAMHDRLQSAYRLVLLKRYGVYLEQHYAALFDKDYAALRAAHGALPADQPYYSLMAAYTAGPVQQAQLQLCSQQDANAKFSGALLDCNIAASRAFGDAEKLVDHDLKDAFLQAARQVQADADAGKLASREELASAFQGVTAARNITFQKQANAAAQFRAKPMADSYAAFYDKTYADIHAAHPAAPGLPYDTLAWQQSFAARSRAMKSCGDEQGASPPARLECFVAASKALDAATGVKDKAVFEAYAQAMARLEADVKADRLSGEEEEIIYKRISDAYEQTHFRVAAAAAAPSAKIKAEDYGARFDKAYSALRTGKPALPNPPFDTAAIAAATAQRDKSIAACAPDDGETLFAYTAVNDDCVVPAYRVFAAAIKLQADDLLQTFINSLHQLAVARDAGDVSAEEYLVINDALWKRFSGVFTSQLSADLAEQNKAVTQEYTALYDKAYAEAETKLAPPAADAVAFDASAVAAADAARNAATTLCKDRVGDYKTDAAWVECWISAINARAAAVHENDKGLVQAYAAAMRAAAAAVDAGTLPAAQDHVAYDAIGRAMYTKQQQQAANLELRLNLPVVQLYSDRFKKAYADGVKAHGKLPLGTPPLDAAADKDASDARDKAVAACNAVVATAVSPKLECNIAAQKIYLAAVKIKDTDLSDAWFDAMRAAVADADAGKLTNAQWRTVYAQLLKDYNAVRARAYSNYLIATNGSTADAYAARFAKEYARAAAQAPKNVGDGPPFDEVAAKTASLVLSAANTQCGANRDPAASMASQIECPLDAWKTFAATVKLRDTALVEALAIAVRAVAADTDAKQLNAVQSRVALEAVETELSTRMTQQIVEYHQRHGAANSAAAAQQN